MIPTRVHGVLDYLVGVLLIAVGAIVYNQYDTTGGIVPMVMGGATIVYSLLTAYELGAVRVIPMTGHLALDFISGIVLAASPWLFGFADRVWAPHVLAGVGEVAVVLLSSRVPGAIARRPSMAP